ncbi:MAG: right-handed parallel beta-helix repeat-containing protein [Elusimicrobiota bacterium]|nr:right-handed parallel beta-helix repeat-containing protein [Elusimicrobiota bacterium]
MRRLLAAGALLLGGLAGAARVHAEAVANCNTTATVAKSGAPTCATIQGCVDAMPNPLAGDHCIFILDKPGDAVPGIYLESVVIRNKVMNNFRLIIGTYTAGVRPSVQPAVGQAAFTIDNASVTLVGLHLSPSVLMPYGVFAASGSIVVSSVTINGGAFLNGAGIRHSSFTLIEHAQIGVGSAYGVYTDAPAGGSWIEASTITNTGSANQHTVYFVGSDSNTIVDSFLRQNGASGSVLQLEGGANYNFVDNSTMTTDSASTGLQLQSSSGNVIVDSYVQGNGAAVHFDQSDDNSLSGVVVASLGTRALQIMSSDDNYVELSLMKADSGWGVSFSGDSRDNLVYESTMTSVSAGHEAAFYDSGTSSNTIYGSYLQNLSGSGARFASGAFSNWLMQSTVSANSTSNGAVLLSGAIENSISGSFVHNSAGDGVKMQADSNFNTVYQSTVIGNGAGYAALGLYDSDTNTVTGSYLQNLSGIALNLASAANWNEISLSTMVINAFSYCAFALDASYGNRFEEVLAINALGCGGDVSAGAHNAIADSRILAGTAANAALSIQSSTGNSVSDTFIQSNAGAALRMGFGALYNTVTQSTMVTLSPSDNPAVLFEFGSGTTTLSYSYAQSLSSTAVRILSGSDGNRVLQSTAVTNAAGPAAVFVAGDGNTLEGVFARNNAGIGLHLASGADGNLLSASTVTSNGASLDAFYLQGASSNTITGVYVEHGTASGNGLRAVQSNYNAVSQSTIVARGTGSAAAISADSDHNQVTAGVLRGFSSEGLRIASGADFNTVSLSTIVVSGVVGNALFVNNADSNTISDCYVENTYGTAAQITISADFTTVERSTMVSLSTFTDEYGLYVRRSSGTTVTASVIQGSTAAFISGSTYTFIGQSVLIATNTRGSALGYGVGSKDIMLASSTLLAPSRGQGVWLGPSNTGAVIIGTVAFMDAGRGLHVEPQLPGFSLTVDSVSFSDLASGATAVFFAGGTFIATFTATEFDSPDLAANVDAAALGVGSRITMRSFTGESAGPENENDPSGFVQWVGYEPYPGCEVTLNVGQVDWSFQSIQGAVNEIPNPLTGHTCVVIEDANSYYEQVVVAGIDTAGSSITIRSRADSGPRPRVQTAAGLAGFLIQNSSVNIVGIDVMPTGTIGYGVYASSGWVSLSTMTIIKDSGGNFNSAGVKLSSWSTASYLDVDASAIAAHGLRLDSDAQRTTVRFSTFVAGDSSVNAVWLNGASSNTLTGVIARNLSGRGLRVDSAAFNLVEDSTFTANGAGNHGADLQGAVRHTLRRSYFSASNGGGIVLNSFSDFNLIERSTAASSGGASINISNSSSNTVTDTRGINLNQSALSINLFSHGNSVARSTFSNNTAASPAVYLGGASSTTLDQTRIDNPGGMALQLDSEAHYTRLLRSSITANGIGINIALSSGIALSEVYAKSSTNRALHFMSANRNEVAHSTFVAENGGSWGVDVDGSDDNLFREVSVYNTQGEAFRIDPGADRNTILGGYIWRDLAGSALFVTGVSSFTLAQARVVSVSGTAATIDSSIDVAVRRSTFSGSTGLGSYGLSLAAVSSATVADSWVSGESGARADGVGYSAFQRSTFTASGGASAFALVNSSWNTVGDIYAQGSGGARAGHLQNQSNFNQLQYSTFCVTDAGNYALELQSASSNTIVGVRAAGTTATAGVIGGQSHWNTVLASTFTSPQSSNFNEALLISASTGTRVGNSYLHASTAVTVTNSSWNTFLNKNRIAAVTTAPGAGCGVLASGGAGELSVTSNTITSHGDGVCLDGGGAFSQGLVSVASNTVSSRRYAVRARSHGAGTTVIVSTNTLLPEPGHGHGGGLDVDGLNSGATIQNNSIYYRTLGGGAGLTQTGVRVRNSNGILFTRNRINNPGLVNGGDFRGIESENAGGEFSHNDVHVEVYSAMGSVYLFHQPSGGGPSKYLHSNVFSSSITASVGGSTYAFYASGGGFISNHNVYHSWNGPAYFSANGFDRSGLAAWAALVSPQDAGSVEGHPLWASNAAGSEDFHPQSSEGRCTDAPACTTFANDPDDSATIDAGDPAASYDAEPAPNGYHANAGSTGGTAEASKSPATECAVLRRVCKTGGCPFSSIQAAVNSLPNPLVGYSCVVIQDSAVYQETVSIASFTLAGSSIIVAVDADLSTGAVLRPMVSNISGAILDIAVASVTVRGLSVESNGFSFAYGVRVTSPSVTLSSVSVYDTGGISVAGIALSTESSLSYSTVTVGGMSASALISSGPWTRLSYSTFAWSGAAAGSNPVVNFLPIASSATLHAVTVFANGAGSKDAVWMTNNAGHAVSRSSFSTNNGGYALQISSGVNHAFDEVFIQNANGRALGIDDGSIGISFSRSSMSASVVTPTVGVVVQGSSHAFSGTSFFSLGSGSGVEVSARGVSFTSVTAYSGSGETMRVTHSTAVTLEHSALYSAGGTALLVQYGAGNRVAYSTMSTASGASGYAVKLQNTSSTTITGSVLYSSAVFSTSWALHATGVTSNTVTDTVIESSGTGGVYLQAASSTTLRGVRVNAYYGTGVNIDSFSTMNAIERSTVVAGGLTSGVGITLMGASSTTVTDSMVVSLAYRGMDLSMQSHLTTVLRSTVIGHGDADAGVYLSNISSASFVESYLAAPSGYGLYFGVGGYNEVLRSTVTSGRSNYPALEFNQSDFNLVDQSVIVSTGNVTALRVAASARGNLVRRSSVTAASPLAFAIGYEVTSGSSNTIEESFLSGYQGVFIAGSDNSVRFSTVIASSLGVYLTGTSQELSHSSVRGASGLSLATANYARVHSNKIQGTGLAANAVDAGNSSDLSFTSNTVTGPSMGAGLWFGAGNGGYTVVSTNTFLPGAAYQVRVGELSLGSTLWITSNTIVPTVSASTTTYGIFIDALTRGATIQDNGIYYRGAPASMGAFVTYGLFARNSSGIRVDHNRYSQPALVSAGGAAAFHFGGTPVDFQFNDVYAAGSGNTAPFLLQLVGAPSAVVRNNVFVNAISPFTDESVVVYGDGASLGGLSSDYNDIHLADVSAYAGRVAGSNRTLEEWQGFGYDLNSISADPVWVSTAPGSEDFHPRTAATNGRYNPATGLFDSTDGTSSPTIDAGDPAASVGDETFPGASRVNQGSYGQTYQASRAAPPPGCESEYTVAPGFYANVAAALAVVDDGPLTNEACVVIRRSTITTGVITVPALVTNGHRLTIMGEPAIRPVYEATNASDGFVILSASVTIKNLLIRPTGNIINAIRSSASDVLVTDIVLDGGSTVNGKAVSLSTRSAVTFSSISARGVAIQLQGTGASVSHSTVIVYGVNGVGLRVDAATAAAIADSTFSSQLSSAGVVLNGGLGTTVARSSFASSGSRAFVVSAASGVVVTSSVFSAPGGSALVFQAGAYDNTVLFSSASSAFNGVPTVLFDGASSNTVTETYLDHAGAGQTVLLQAGAHRNTLSRGYIDGHSAQAPVYALNSSSLTLSDFSIYNAVGDGVRLESGSNYARIERTTVTAGGTPNYALSADGSTGLTVVDSVLDNQGTTGRGITLTNGANRALVERTTVQSNGSHAFEVVTSSYTTITDAFLRQTSGGFQALRLSDSHGALVSRATMTAAGGSNAVIVLNGRDNTLAGSYASASQGVYIDSALRTTVRTSLVQSTSFSEGALRVVNTSSDTLVHLSTFVAELGGMGISIESNVTGSIVIASNTIPYYLTGPQRGISIANVSASARVLVASNTIIPAVSGGADSCAICLSNLSNGATVQNNSVYYRSQQSAITFTAHGLYASSTPGLVVERNRISNPGMITGGSYMGVSLTGSPRARVKNNDIFSATAAGFPLVTAYGLSVLTSDNITIKNNVFSSSLTVTGSSATFRIDGPSTAGSDSDYNIHHSSTARNTMLDSSGVNEYPLSGSIDENSLTLNPHWPSVVPGAEDFHPRSQAGRYDPSVPGFVNDGWTAGSLDRGDEQDPVGFETAPNGGRVNMGSYGGTDEASRTPSGAIFPTLGSVQASSVSLTFVMVGADRYSVTASTTQNFSTVLVSSMSAGANATELAPQGLIPNTTYFLLAAAHWGDAYVGATPVISTPTLALAPGAPAATPFPAVHRTSMTASWTTGGNPLSATTFTVTFAAVTGSVSVSTLPSVVSAEREATGLTPNTTYLVTVTAVNHAGVPTAATVIGSTATRANEPLSAATTFHAVLDQSLSVSWDRNLNPLSITSYTVHASTAGDFNAGASSVSFTTAPVFGPSAVVSGLTPATTYFFRVQALNGDGERTAFTVLGSTVMLPLQIQAPVTQPVTASSTHSLTASWGLSSNATGYTLFASTMPDNPPLAVWASSTVFGQATATATVESPALLANTTYFLFVRANGFNGNSVYANYAATTTVPATPAAAATPFTAVRVTSLTVAWLEAGNPVDRTTFTVVMSTSGVFAPTDAGNVRVTTLTPASPTAEVFGLTPNTTYTAFVAALSHAGSSTPFINAGSTTTRAEQPGVPAVPLLNVLDQSLDLVWLSSGNPLGLTTYTVVGSTAADFNAGASSVTLSTVPVSPGAHLSGFLPGATYYFQVRAIGHDGVASPYTFLASTAMLPLQIVPPGVQPVTAASTHSITAAWGLVANATGYTLVASTEPLNPPVTVWASSQTFGQSVTTATVEAPSLAPNTTYYLFVRAHGFTANSTFALFPATATLPATPVTAVTTVSAVNVTSFTVSWLSGGNPLGFTTYTVVASTAADFNAGASSVTLSTVPAAGPMATLTGLGAYAVWFVQVRAVGHGVSASPFVSLGSTQTLPIDLPAPVTAATGVSASSMTAFWSLVPGATGYTLAASYAATNPPVGVVASSVVAGVAATSASVSGLAPNTTHFLFVRADGPGNSGPYAVFAATATDPLPPQPDAATFTGLAETFSFVNWQQGANPVGVTSYTVTLSTTPTFPNDSLGNQTASVVPTAAAASQGLAGLVPNTTYHAFVEARSHAGARFGTVLGSTATLAAAPYGVVSTFTTVGISSVALQWASNGNPLAVTTYTVQASTASDFNAFASSVSLTTAPAAGPSAVLTGLAFGTTWYFRVLATNHNGVPSAFHVLGSTYTNLSNLIPQISDFQSGDDQWRRVNNGTYDVRFQDASSLHLDKVQVSVSTTPGGAGDLVPFTDAFTGLSPADSYATPFPLPAAVFNAMLEGATNYVTVRVFNLVPATNTIVDAFYVRKDTTPPAFTNGEAGGDSVVQTAAGRLYAVSARDLTSGLDAFQYSVSLTPGAGDGAVLGWTDIAVLNGATEYATAWPVAFASLQTGATNYVSVRAVDMAGSTTTLVDAFRVLKDTVGPSVTISTPAVGTGFVSALSTAEGGATGAFGVQGAEIAVLDAGTGFYWNPGTGLYNAVNPVWMAAVGASSWTASLAGIPFADSTAYKIVARSSTTYSLYSTVYATASFTLDTTTPTVAVTAPAPLAVVATLPIISGTAADAGAAPSGVFTIEVRLKRLSDGLYWNWFSDAWGVSAVSSVTAGAATWSVTPSALLQANLVSGASYYVAVRASDSALPANSGDFFAQGSTFTFNDPTPPAAIADLAAVNGPQSGQIALTWTAQGAHGATGITAIGQYAVFGSTDNLAVPSTSAANTIVFATATVVPGAFQGYLGTGLTPGVTYFIYVAMANADGNWSAFSNLASTTATPSPSDAIQGHVVNASTQGITAVRIDAFDSTGLLVATAFTLADGSGTYSVNGLTPGNYKIEASWTANGITSSVWIDAIPMGSVNIDFSLDINYALATLTGTLGALSYSGQAGLGVAGSGYRPSTAGSRVELYQNGREVSRAGVDPTGRWTIAHLLPGTYSVRAYTGLAYTDFQEVNLAEGEIRTVGFVFNPLPEASVFAFPNPARHSTTIRFETALQPLEAQIAIFDLKGGLVREVPGSQITATATPGVYHYVWDLTNSRGTGVASGVYLFMVKVKGGSENQLVKVIKKLAVVR